MSSPERGLITIAYGSEKYYQMGRAFALSVRHHSNSEKIAVVTDNRENFEGLFDFIIPIDLSYGSGITQKLYIDLYTPFQQTLFVDSDCLLYGPSDVLWNFYSVEEGVGARSVGRLVHGGSCLGVSNMDRYLDHLGIDGMPNVKGGFYYFDDSESTRDVFTTARGIYEERDIAGLTSFKGAVNEEPIMGAALEITGQGAHPTNKAPVNTYLGEVEPVDVNVLDGKSRFIKNGTPVEPSSIHYGVGTQDGWVYLRDICRLELNRHASWPDSVRFLAPALALYMLAMRQLSNKWKILRKRVRKHGPKGVIPRRIVKW